MPSTHLTPSAYDEVGKEFLMRTGLEYTPKQVRNKWTKLKHEYNTFKKLKLRETGGGWDFEKNIVKQDNEWWKKAKVDFPGCGNLKKHGLRNEEGLRILFEDISVDGTDHWNPASGLPPPSSSALKTALNVDEITDLDLEDDTEEQPSQTVASSSKVRLGVTIPEKNKKPKTAQVMQEEIRKITSIAQASHTSFQSFLKKDETVSIASTMDLVNDCGVIDGTDEHFIATELFLKREQREMFLHMTSDSRKGWLRRRTFGVWKMKWQILLKMPNYSFQTQMKIVVATMTLHNYVRLHDKDDIHFVRCERDPDYVPTIPDRYKKYVIPSSASDASTSEASAPDMDRFRNELATTIALGW
ncbi:hypothetical protein VPH35_087898 [Triticum aestivum]